MADLTRVLRALYCETWLVRPEMHRQLCEIALAHVAGDHTAADAFAAQYPGRDDYARKRNTPQMVGRGVAVIQVSGVIGRRFSTMLNYCGVTSVDVLEQILKAAADDMQVRAVVLDIDSPGGTVSGTPEAVDAVDALAAVKPVVAWTGGMMCSAAYWIAAPCDAVFCANSADVGSIGVYAALLDSSRWHEMQGLNVEVFKKGKYKAMGVPGTTLSEEQRALIQGDVDEIYRWFTEAVTANRNVAEGAMEGQSMLGPTAVQSGLADGIRTLEEAIEWAETAADERQ